MRTMAVILALLMLVLSGCGDSGDELGIELDTSEPWDLVWFSDSMGWGVAEAWADQIEDAEGVEVRVHDHAIGGQSIEQVRNLLRDSETYRQKVIDAEIIVVYGNPSYTAPADTNVCPLTLSTVDRDPPEFHTSADFAPYGDVFRDIFGLIFELRAGEPTVIRVFDEYAGMLADWRASGIEAECTAAWEASAGAIQEAADEYGVATASFYDAFNGTDHDEDPREKGYIAGDGRHATPEGVLIQVEVLHSLGYSAITP